MHKSFVLVLSVLIILIAVQPTVEANESNEFVIYKIEKTYVISNQSSSDATDVVARIYLLDNRNGWASQQILSEEVNVNGSPRAPLPSGGKDNRPMKIQLGNIDGGNSKTIEVSQLVKVGATSTRIIPSETVGDIPAQYQKYTEPVAHLWQSDDPRIRNKASELTAGENNYYSKALRILEWVENHTTYRAQEDEHDAIWCYERNLGDCSEYSNLFIALARAAGIPAKAVSGYLSEAQTDTPESSDLMRAGHQWAIIYLPSTGWVPVDPTYNIPQGQFGEMSNDHLIELTSDGSNWVQGTEIEVPSPYVSYRYSGRKPDIDIESSGTIKIILAVEPTLRASSEITNDTWRFTVKVRNSGSQKVENVKVELIVENAYFEAPSAQNLGTINPGTQGYAYFDVLVKNNVENSPMRAIITYDTENFGHFVLRKEIYVTYHFTRKIYELPWSDFVVLIVVLIVVILGVVKLLRR